MNPTVWSASYPPKLSAWNTWPSGAYQCVINAHDSQEEEHSRPACGRVQVVESGHNWDRYGLPKGILHMEQKWIFHTLASIAGVHSRPIPGVHSTVHAGHRGGVHVRELARLLYWGGVLLTISHVTRVTGDGELLGTWCWLRFTDRERGFASVESKNMKRRPYTLAGEPFP